MIKVNCRTNLDLAHAEEWPTELPAVPNIGHKIQSKHKWQNNFQLVLEVVDVRWEYVEGYVKNDDSYKPFIELHIPRYRNQSISDFYEWYAPLVGRRASSFI